ncbi:MAG TPA: nuclear transport factor 2 family protein [Solirubrobacterales bacterium]
MIDGLGAALRAGDVGAAVSLFSSEGCFVTPDSTVIQGTAQIRAFLQQLVDTAADLTIEQRTMLRAGDVAVGSESWSMRIGRAGDAPRRVSRSTIVLGRTGGIWRIAVADPWRG